MKHLRSHPRLYLFQHLDQMRQATKAVLSRHSRALLSLCGEVLDWIDEGITFHDAGKGSGPFQEYIPDPDHYRGNKQLKAHTPLSLLCVLAHGRERQWDWRRLLAVATLAAGHHSEFKTELELRDVCGSDSMISVLKHQLDRLDWEALDDALGLRVTRIPPGDALAIVAAADDQIEALFERLHESPDRLGYRLRCQLAFSILLEADKAFLAIPPADLDRYLDRSPADLPPSLVDEHLARKPAAAANPLRSLARATLVGRIPTTEARIQTMTLPTGTGKTLLGATWALTHRQHLARDGSPTPKVVIVLPFLSIVDQTIKEYEKLLGSRVAAGDLVGYHSLSERTFDPELDANSQEFFLDTWQSDVVITTFDQLLLAIFSPRTKHQLRFHNLADALIVLDEVQSLPCILWEPVRRALGGLAGLGSTRVLAMSATQPGFLSDAVELIPEPGAFFGRMNRYRLVLKHRSPLSLSEFAARCRARLPKWKQRRVLITLNTRRSARQIFNALSAKSRKLGLPVFFITGDKTPRDRLAAIDAVKAGGPCLVLSTQCVEAGVDFDMDLVIRDFAPLDSLVQIAGRCNRNGERPVETVEIVSLLDDESSRPFAPMIYDAILLQETTRVLEGAESIDEDQVYGLTRRYFDLLRDKKNRGTAVFEAWINWEETESIRRLLRGLQRPQTAFVVVDQDRELPGLLTAARDIPDRWDRRRRFRGLAARIARITVTVVPSINSDFDPGDLADAFPENATQDEAWFWLLRPGAYDPEGGLDVGDRRSEEPSWGMLL